jgi:hypothetical protein
MSKKKGKPAARKAPKKAAKKKAAKKSMASKPVAKKSVSESRPTPRLAGAAPSRRTKTATIMIFQTSTGTKIRTSPQRLYANPGDHIEFNVVNMIDDSEVEATIEFCDGGPWGKDPFHIRNWDRKPVGEASHGRFKYCIKALGVEEDPEVEIPEM